RCLPVTGAFGNSLFADADCKTGAAFVYTAPDQQASALPDYARINEGMCADARERIYRLGAPIAGDVYSHSTGTCRKARATPGAKASLRGEEIVPSGLDEFPDIVLGGGRLHVAARPDPQGALDSDPGTTPDTVLKQPCHFDPTADGKAHCLPNWDPQ